MSIYLNLLVIAIASYALIKGASLFIKSTTHIAHHFNISIYTISFFVIAIGTSLPELVVGITSAYEGDAILGFANVIGSNVALMTIIVGIPALIGHVVSTRSLVNSKEIYTTALAALLPLIFVADGTISRIEGILLISGYILYAMHVMKQAHGVEHVLDKIEYASLYKRVLLLIFSLLLLLASSELIVKSAVNLSAKLGLGLGFIGLSITALGTSLPEISLGITAIKEKNNDGFLGNIMGSIVANSTLVVGLTALVSPIKIINHSMGVPTIFLTIFITLLFVQFIKTKQRILRWEAVVLVIAYFIFLGVEYFLSVV